MAMGTVQLGLWDPALPEGFEYRADLLSPEEEADLLEQFRRLDFREFEFRGYLGKRRVVSFGLHYDFDHGRVHAAEEIPDFLMPLRETAAAFARIAAAEIEHVLVAEYPPGAGIGWHRDRPVFRDVVGVSLASACRFRLRRKRGSSWDRTSLIVEPRSVYLLRGPARTGWEHSIPPSDRLRYSVTFRRLKAELGLAKEEHSR
jgi:alkylated DNA repair dioxygenase AlkB